MTFDCCPLAAARGSWPRLRQLCGSRAAMLRSQALTAGRETLHILYGHCSRLLAFSCCFCGYRCLPRMVDIVRCKYRLLTDSLLRPKRVR